MDKKKQLSTDMRNLRARAEKRVTPEGKQDIARMSPYDIAHLIHELETHRIELEMQNDDLRKTQEELVETRDQYSDLYNFAPVGYITLSDKGLILQANLTFAEMLGFPKAGLINQPLSAYIVEEDQDIYFLHRRKVLETRKKQCCELRLRIQSAEPFWVQMESVPVESPDSEGGRIRSALSDITERMRAEEELRKHREYLEELVGERTSDLARANRVTQGINEIFQKALTCETEKQLGGKCLAVAARLTDSKISVFVEFNSAGLEDTTTISDLGWDACDMAVANAEQSIKNMEIRGIDLSTIREGKSRIVNGDEMAGRTGRGGLPEGYPEISAFLGVPLKREGKTIGMIGLGNKEGGYELVDQEAIETLSVAIVEVMVRNRAELLLSNARAELARKERLAVLGQLSGVVGHELRNPMGVISNAVYYLNLTLSDDDETTKEYLEIIGSEVSKADKIVFDLFNLSCTKPAEKEEIAVSALVAQVLEKQPPPDNVKVVSEIPDDLPPVSVDLQQIGQVLSNLLTNACQAMDEGGDLTIKAKEEKCKILISITDTGHGMSEDTLNKLFEPLFTTKARGIGLGMTVVKNFVEVNGGSIKVESEEGQGTTFTVVLPIEGQS